MSNIDKRLNALEKATNAAQEVNCASQVVIYNPVTGEPLVQPDPKAARQIWIPDNGRGMERITR